VVDYLDALFPRLWLDIPDGRSAVTLSGHLADGRPILKVVWADGSGPLRGWDTHLTIVDLGFGEESPAVTIDGHAVDIGQRGVPVTHRMPPGEYRVEVEGAAPVIARLQPGRGYTMAVTDHGGQTRCAMIGGTRLSPQLNGADVPIISTLAEDVIVTMRSPDDTMRHALTPMASDVIPIPAYWQGSVAVDHGGERFEFGEITLIAGAGQVMIVTTDPHGRPLLGVMHSNRGGLDARADLWGEQTWLMQWVIAERDRSHAIHVSMAAASIWLQAPGFADPFAQWRTNVTYLDPDFPSVVQRQVASDFRYVSSYTDPETGVEETATFTPRLGETTAIFFGDPAMAPLVLTERGDPADLYMGGRGSSRLYNGLADTPLTLFAGADDGALTHSEVVLPGAWSDVIDAGGYGGVDRDGDDVIDAHIEELPGQRRLAHIVSPDAEAGWKALTVTVVGPGIARPLRWAVQP